jgi:hypothetical protein
MTTRAEFTPTTKLAAWHLAGGPNAPCCECHKINEHPGKRFDDCGGQPITKSDPAEYHHIEEAESDDGPERRKYLRSIANCLCVRQSCHKRITRTETMPKIVKSRRQRMGEANISRPKQIMPGSKASKWRKPLHGPAVLRDGG